MLSIALIIAKITSGFLGFSFSFEFVLSTNNAISQKPAKKNKIKKIEIDTSGDEYPPLAKTEGVVMAIKIKATRNHCILFILRIPTLNKYC